MFYKKIAATLVSLRNKQMVRALTDFGLNCFIIMALKSGLFVKDLKLWLFAPPKTFLTALLLKLTMIKVKKIHQSSTTKTAEIFFKCK